MTPIQLDFKPSMWLITILLCFAILVSVIVLLADLAWYWQLIIFVTIVLSTAYAIAKHGMRSLPWSVLNLAVNVKHELQVVRKDGQRFSAQVKASTVVTPYLTVIQISPLQDQVHEKAWRLGQAIIVVPDNVDRDAYRQLRVWLRWGDFRTADQPSS